MLAAATLARPYARAAFEAAESAGEVERWSEALGLAAAVAGSGEARRLLTDPRLDAEQVLSLFSDVGGEHMSEPVINFLKVLMVYRRLPLLPEIFAQFEHLRRQRERRIRVHVASAVELNDGQRQKLTERLRQRFGVDVDMDTEVDPDLLGGLVVRAGDQVIDASIRGRLEQLERQLSR